jgi:hypothetical protein
MPFIKPGSLCLVALVTVFLSGCSKSLTHSGSDLSGGNSVQASSYLTLDPGLSPFYGDSVLYVRGTGRSAYLFTPANALSNGKFVAWPAGLKIDQQTGEIDVLQSEPGSRYNVGFVNATTGDTAYRQIILAGVTYPDGVYFVNDTDPVLGPAYNANLNGGVVNGVFDEEGLAVSASAQHLMVNTTTGAIDLRASLQQGLFGNNPQNGDSRSISIYYRLNDESQGTLLRSTVNIYYFNTLADVPQDLLQAAIANHNDFNTGFSTQKTVTGTPAAVSVATTPTAAKPAPAPTPARPPQILIVNAGHL